MVHFYLNVVILQIQLTLKHARGKPCSNSKPKLVHRASWLKQSTTNFNSGGAYPDISQGTNYHKDLMVLFSLFNQILGLYVKLGYNQLPSTSFPIHCELSANNSNSSVPCSNSGQVMWNLWWNKWYWGMFSHSTSTFSVNSHSTTRSTSLNHEGYYLDTESFFQ